MTAEQWQILIPAIVGLFGALAGLAGTAAAWLRQRSKARAAEGEAREAKSKAGELAERLEAATSIPPECADCEHSKAKVGGGDGPELAQAKAAAKTSCTDCLAKLGELERRLGRVGDTVAALAKLGGVKLPAPELPDEAKGD